MISESTPADVLENEIGLTRRVRPNFAEDVYGEKKCQIEDGVEYSESSLAQRRSAVLLKLKQLKDAPGTIPDISTGLPRPESVDMTDRDIDFNYTDCDTLNAELAELYSYSELDDFASNVQCWKIYADQNQAS
uniref:Uncharacterized protein n=1 Tax=Heterorhabditis bacteriophora TaxID=37862 RepID=A0A1I7XTJ2_HETBA